MTPPRGRSGKSRKTATGRSGKNAPRKGKSGARGGKDPAAATKKPSTALKRRARSIKQRLEEAYPEAESALNSRNAFEMLCSTIMSAQCTDKKVNEVAPRLYDRYPDAASMARADLEQVKELIRQTGFFNQKAKNLVAMSQALVERHDGEVPGRMEDLVELPGVGRKTAWCVLTKYFDDPGIIVDTHFKRVTARLGLHVEEDPVKIEFALNELIPKEERGLFSHEIISHGRTLCEARKPKCPECFLRDLCPSSHLGGG